MLMEATGFNFTKDRVISELKKWGEDVQNTLMSLIN